MIPPTRPDRDGSRSTVDGKTAHVDLRPEDRPPGVLFDRFGIVTTWIDGNGQSIYFDDLTYTATQDDDSRSTRQIIADRFVKRFRDRDDRDPVDDPLAQSGPADLQMRPSTGPARRRERR